MPGASVSPPLRVLVLNGSPHSSGNTTALADLFLGCLGEASGGCAREILSAYDLAVAPCTACGGCVGTGVCVVDDGMRLVWEALGRADCLVIASPLHFTSLTAPLVAIISRWQSFWQLRRAVGSPSPVPSVPRCGVVVATGGAEYKDMFECARRVAYAGFVTLGVEPCGVLAVSKMDAGGGACSFSAAVRGEAEALARGVTGLLPASHLPTRQISHLPPQNNRLCSSVSTGRYTSAKRK